MDRLYDNISLENLKSTNNAPGHDHIYEDPIAVDVSRVETEIKSDVSLVIDKRYYDFICKFKKSHIDRIRKGCLLEIVQLGDDSCNEIQISFTKPRTDTCTHWQDKFSAFYDEVSRELTVEQIHLADYENVSKLINKIKSHCPSLITKQDQILQLVCERKAVDGIRSILDRYRLQKPSVASLSIPIGYDINGAFSVYIHLADITKLNVDVIANITNERFQNDSGISKCIIQAAGSDLLQEAKEYLDKKAVKTSDVFRTKPGYLPCKVVIHAIAPEWRKGAEEMGVNTYRKKLMETYENVLAAADKERCKTVALPVVDEGVPSIAGQAAVMALKEVLLALGSKFRKPKLKEVHLVDTKDNVLNLLLNELMTGGRLKTRDGKHVIVKVFSDTETETVINNVTLQGDEAGIRKASEGAMEQIDSTLIGDCEYAVVKKKVIQDQSPEVKPLLPRKKPIIMVKPKEENDVALYENTQPPIPRKNENLMAELKEITRKPEEANVGSIGDQFPMQKQASTKNSARNKTTAKKETEKGDPLSKTNNPILTTTLSYSEPKSEQPTSGDESAASIYMLAGPISDKYEEVLPNGTDSKLEAGRRHQENPEPKSKQGNAFQQTSSNLIQRQESASKQVDLIYENVNDSAPLENDEPRQQDTECKSEKRKESDVSLVIDKRFYSFICKFKKLHIDRIRKGCLLEIVQLGDDSCNEIQISFTKPRTDTCTHWQDKFSAFYDEVSRELTVEQIHLEDYENESKLINKIKSHCPSLITKQDQILQLVCERKAVDGIRSILDRYRLQKPSAASLSIPIGYDINGAFSVYIHLADIAKLNVDVIANITNERFQNDSGISKCIIQAAGSDLLQEAKEYLDKKAVKTSDVFRTKPGNLPCKVVIHAIAPEWRKGAEEMNVNTYKKKLMETYENVLAAADKERCRTVALCLISDSPNSLNESVAEVLKEVIINASQKYKKTKLQEMHIIDTKEDTLKVLVNLLNKVSQDKTPNKQKVHVVLLSAVETRQIAGDKGKEQPNTRGRAIFNKLKISKIH